jgi:glyoxalase family protein
MKITGMHHVSAVSAHISASHRFYSRTLGMRPLIKTVNQDDTSMYHMFYGDGAGSPGSDMTIFDIPRAVRERRGNNSITRTSFRVPGERALEYWVQRLRDAGIEHTGILDRGGRHVIDVCDVEGTQLSLVDDGMQSAGSAWNESPVPPEFQIRGLAFNMITVPVLDPTHHFLTAGLGFRAAREYAENGRVVHVYEMGVGGANAEIHVVVDPSLPTARHGAGGVHHIAVRTSSSAHSAAWVEHLDSLGYVNSGVVNRHYFVSVYVREPNHVLFEIASDDPGFEVDGPIDIRRLSLPPFLEPRRAQIEASLQPLED